MQIKNSNLLDILNLLSSGSTTVKVRSMFRSDHSSYPLLDIAKGPFSLKEEDEKNILTGFDSKTDQEVGLRINDSGYVELRKEKMDWYGPEMGGVILLIDD